MKTVEAGAWFLHVDTDETRRLYALSESAGAADCACSGCRNYLLLRDRARPSALLDLLHSLGIDADKEAEIHEWGPATAATLTYAGWWHFLGSSSTASANDLVLQGSASYPESTWRISFKDTNSCVLDTLDGRIVVQVEFLTELPWVLDEPFPYPEVQSSE